MEADDGLRRLFEKPLPENPTLLEALSAWNRVHPKRPVDPTSFTEIFGELHFQEKQQQQPDHVARGGVLPPPRPPPPPPVRAATVSSSSWIDVAEKSKDDSSLDVLLRPPKPTPTVKRSASFSMKKSPSASSLLLCTEGLGSESTVDVLRDDDDELAAAFRHQEETRNDADVVDAGAANEEEKENQRPPPSFPPPIRSISVRGGKPSVCFRSFRAEGRFVLVQVLIPGKELLRASREGGRLRLQFAGATAHA